MSSFFPASEVRCKCGICDGSVDVLEPDFLHKLNLLRMYLNRPVTLNSCVRCKDHPVEKKKQSPGSHFYGIAADIRVSGSRDRYEVIAAAMACGITRVGVANSFVHVDIGDVKFPDKFPANVIWLYS